MKPKNAKSKQEKTVVLSVGTISKAGIDILGKFLKKADEVKKSKITITLDRE